MLLSLDKDYFRKNRRLCVYRNSQKQGRKTLIFFHDIGSCGACWQPIWRHFSDVNNVVAYDMIGHGLSDAPNVTDAYSVSQQIFDAQSVIERYKSTNIVLIAHGYGAIIALLLSALYKEIAKVILIDPSIYAAKNTSVFDRMPAWVLQGLFWLKHKKITLNRDIQIGDLLHAKAKQVQYFKKSLSELPELDLTSLTAAFMVISSQHELLDEQGVKLFYQKKLPVCKFKQLSLSTRFPMRKEPNAVNYYVDTFLEQMDVRAFRNLVFEGAGIRGIAYAGTLLSLDSLGVLENIKRVAGSSAGSIYATFLAVGYTANEIFHIVRDLDFSSLTGAPSNILATSTRFLSDYGWYRGDMFIKVMGELIERKTGNPNITFRQLREQGGRALYIVGTNLSKSGPEVYCHETTPEMSINEAVRISTSIPLLFQVMRRKDNEGDHVLVDGGVSWNYPIEIFDYYRFVDNPSNAEDYPLYTEAERCFNHESLGFRLDPFDDPLHSISEDSSYKKIGNVIDFGRAFMKFMHAATMKRHLHKQDWNRTIYVNTLEIGGTDFDISQDDKMRLIEEGKRGVHKHFSWRLGKEGMKYPQ